MALTHKPGPAQAISVVGNEYPTELFPPLPATMLKRFPELEAWQRAAEENFTKLLDVLIRRDRETNSSIAAVSEQIP